MTWFNWATETNYPAGTYAWSGQPLAVAPLGDYFVPSPAGNPATFQAETLNYVLKQHSQGIGTVVTSVTAMRALPVPVGAQTVTLTPSNNALTQTFSYNAANPVVPGFGGIYYYDAAYTALDNGSTTVKPTAVGSGAGAFRLCTGSMLTTIAEQFYDSAVGTASASAGTTANETTTYYEGIVLALNPSGLYLGDVILAEMCGHMALSAAGTGKVGFGAGTSFGGLSSFGPRVNGLQTVADAITFPFAVQAMYVVGSTDITNGVLLIAPTVSSVTTTTLMTVESLRYTTRRP